MVDALPGLKTIDQNLTSIRSVEGGWGMPKLPEDVALDLAAAPFTPDSIGGFLTGVADDIQSAQRVEPLPVRKPELWSPFDGVGTTPADYTNRQNIARLIAGITGQDAPRVYNENAVVRWRQRAVDMGYLDIPESQIRDPRVRPEDRAIFGEMARETAQAQFSGQEPGSIPINRVMDMVDEWLSPRGLYRAATELDLFWDVGEIATEMSDWGDKWRRFRDDPNFFSFIDALSGPVDDMVFPAVNIALLLTGVSEVYLTGKALWVAGKGVKGVRATLKAADAVETLRGAEYVAKRGLFGVKAGDRGADLARLSDPSWLSRKIAGGFNPWEAQEAGKDVRAASMALAKWRDMKGVALAKKANQQVLRAGFMSNAQQLIGDTHAPGNYSIEGALPGTGPLIDSILGNAVVDLAADAFLYPNNIFEPGTYTRIGSLIGRSALYVTPGYSKVTESEKMVAAWYHPVKEYVEQQGGREAGKAFARAAKKRGVAAAVMEFAGIPAQTPEEIGAAMFRLTVAAGVDGYSRRSVKELTARSARLSDMDTPTRDSVLAVQGQLRAQLAQYDDLDIEDAADILSEFGGKDFDTDDLFEWGEDLVATQRRTDSKVKAQRRTMTRESLYEDEAVTAARGGRVGDNEVRLYGKRIVDGPEASNVEWSATPWEGVDDSRQLVVDIDLDEVAEWGGMTAAEAAADVHADVQRYGTSFRRRFNGATLETIGQARRYDPEKLLNFKKLIRRHNEMRQEALQNIIAQVDVDYLETYIFEYLHKIGNYGDHLAASEAVEAARLAGGLDNAKLKPLMNEHGRMTSFDPSNQYGEKIGRRAAAVVTADALNDSKAADAAARSWMGPLVRDLDPTTFNYTPALKDTLTKQDANIVARRASETLQMRQAVHNLRVSGKFDDVARVIDENITGTQAVLFEGAERTARDAKWTDQARAKAVAAALDDAGIGVGKKTQKDINRLVRYVQESPDAPTMQGLEEALDRRIEELISSEKWSEFGVPSGTGRSAANSQDRLRALYKELDKQARYIAAEVENIPKQLARELEDRGYKLVYGIAFQQPHHLDDMMPELAAIKRRHVNSLHVDSFFSRQDPGIVRELKMRNVKAALIAEMGHDAGGTRKLRLDMGNLEDNSGDMDMVLHDLWDIHDEIMDAAKHPKGGLISRAGNRIQHSRLPYSVDRLASDMKFSEFMTALVGRGYTEDEAKAIFRALQRSQKLGFQRYGLFNIEATLRSRPLVADALNLFGKVDLGGSLARTADEDIRWGTRMAKNMTNVQTLGGVAAGSYIGQEQGGGGGALAGGLIGGALGHQGYRLASPAVNRVANAAVNSNKMKWLYLPDNLANVRDLFRFSLSPIFDASRYTEAVILSQIGELPEESMRLLKLNQSPRKVRKLIAERRMAEGHSKVLAQSFAGEEWGKIVDEFFSAARGDFAMEAVDSVNRRFSSQGILGFSPSDWMASTFWHLQQNGVSSRKAYETVREMYTYGTTGRSAAELSMNFVFFPFSFTKKIVGHMGKFFQQDLGRLILIQDAMATYNLLNDHYDLSAEWRDRLPILESAHRLNVLAYGLSLGRFGGVNAPIMDVALGSMPGEKLREGLGAAGVEATQFDEVMNLFLPQAVMISNDADANNVTDLMRSLLPAVNDIKTLTEDALRQAQVFDGDFNFVTDQAEARKGWDSWREYQTETVKTLGRMGMTWDQAIRDPVAGAIIKQKRAEISAMYPAWKNQMGDWAGDATTAALEKEERLRAPSGSPADDGLAVYEVQYRQVGEALRERGFSYETPEELPIDAVMYLRRLAIDVSKEYDGFERLYRRFYRQSLGDITEELV
jgi:hypothetical protein